MTGRRLGRVERELRWEVGQARWLEFLVGLDWNWTGIGLCWIIGPAGLFSRSWVCIMLARQMCSLF